MDNPDEFEKIFQTMTSVVLGKKLTGFKDYEKWLLENVMPEEYAKSILSDEMIYLPPFSFYREIKHNVVSIEEGYDIIGKKHIPEKEIETISLSNANKLLKDISTTAPNTIYGENSNIQESSFYYNSHNGYKSCALNKCKNCLCSFWPRQSENMIGCYYVFSSQFCIKCYNSENLNRCFELSDCSNCTDSLFCHNCENLTNCMFCFNAKSLKYAIGNIEVGKEKYLEIKKKVLSEIVNKLEKEKKLELNIFNMGDR